MGSPFGRRNVWWKWHDVAAVYYDWDHKAVKLLKDCLDETNAKIVISSGWREYNNEDKLKALFKIHGMDGYIVDTLPKGLKEIVIKNYLDSNAELVESYAVKDDRISAGSIFYK